MDDKTGSDSSRTAAGQQPAASAANTIAGDQQKLWYVLLGMSGRSLDTGRVKELYDANKVRIRGPYTWDEIIRSSEKGLIKDDTIIYKKGEVEWAPFDRHKVRAADHPAETPAPEEDVKEWYILAGMAGKVMDVNYIKELFDAGKVKIRGPFTKGEIIRHYNGDAIQNDTMIYKKGDRDWKPLASQNIQGIKEVIKSAIFDSGTDEVKSISRKKAHLANTLNYVIRRKIAIAATVISACAIYFVGSYYYYIPENIYGRIKKSVVLITTTNNENSTNPTSLGSGFIIDDSGIIVTNLHVIGKSARITVKSGDNTTYDIEGVLHIDAKNDLALLKIRKSPHEIVKIARGNSDKVAVGERVYTIGNPGGMEFSLSEGIVSGKRNESPVDKKPRELIQITAPISPGNSGGPVLDKKGRVIGIATMGSRNDFQNLNFAVPVKLVGDTAKYNDIVCKFLPEKSEWRLIAAHNNSENLFAGASGPQLESMEAYYNQDSIARYGYRKVRLWVKVNIKYRQVYFRSNPNFSPVNELTDIGLIELDCEKNKYRYNINIASDNKDRSISEADFSEDNKWQDMDGEDKKDFEEVCR